MSRRTPPRDTLDLPRLRDGARREVPWDAELPVLDAQRRFLLGDAWRWRMEQEHLAVGAFSMLAIELATLGCDAVVLALVTRAAADEVRHTDVCRRLAVRHLGADAVPVKLRGVPALPERADLAPEDRALCHLVEMCCLNETLTGVYFTEMLERTTHPLARAAVQSLLEDELDHGRVGWTHLAAVRRDGGGAILAAELPGLLLESVKPVIDEARQAPEADDPELEAHGYLGRTRAAAIYRRALDTVIFPGFELLGIDLTASRALARDEGWIEGGL